jgi:hypothetical protein
LKIQTLNSESSFLCKVIEEEDGDNTKKTNLMGELAKDASDMRLKRHIN